MNPSRTRKKVIDFDVIIFFRNILGNVQSERNVKVEFIFKLTYRSQQRVIILSNEIFLSR